MWVADPGTPAARPRAVTWALGAAVLVFIGSFMPFASVRTLGLYTWEVQPGAVVVSALFGVVLAVLALGTRLDNKPLRVASGVLLSCGAGFGALGYGGFAVLGLSGFDSETSAGIPIHVEFTPGAGLVACFTGCVIAMVASLKAMTRG
jgi:hypothetical protein